MSKNLKQILQLGEPKKLNGVSGVEAKAFKKAFQAALQEIGKSLSFTASHATQEEHDGLASKRDKTILAYQRVVKQIDPANPAASEGAMKRVNKSVSTLRGGAQALQDSARRRSSVHNSMSRSTFWRLAS